MVVFKALCSGSGHTSPNLSGVLGLFLQISPFLFGLLPQKQNV